MRNAFTWRSIEQKNGWRAQKHASYFNENHREMTQSYLRPHSPKDPRHPTNKTSIHLSRRDKFSNGISNPTRHIQQQQKQQHRRDLPPRQLPMHRNNLRQQRAHLPHRAVPLQAVPKTKTPATPKATSLPGGFAARAARRCSWLMILSRSRAGWRWGRWIRRAWWGGCQSRMRISF